MRLCRSAAVVKGPSPSPVAISENVCARWPASRKKPLRTGRRVLPEEARHDGAHDAYEGRVAEEAAVGTPSRTVSELGSPARSRSIRLDFTA